MNEETNWEEDFDNLCEAFHINRENEEENN